MILAISTARSRWMGLQRHLLKVSWAFFASTLRDDELLADTPRFIKSTPAPPARCHQPARSWCCS
jgi:hypothetical protein